MAERLVVVGGNAAAMSAASQARRRRGAEDLEIVAFERGGTTSYSSCGIPYWIGDVVDDVQQLIVRSPEVFRDQYSIDARVGHEVTTIDLDRRRVRVRELATGDENEEPFDQLLVATGAVPVRPDVPGLEGPGVFGVQTLDDGQAILDRLAEQPRRAVVVGAGYIGLEMAEAMVVRGLEVTIVERTSRPAQALDPDLGDMVADALEDMGIGLRLDLEVEGIERDGDGALRAVATADGTLQADLVLLGTGTRPDSGLAAEAGIPVGRTGGIEVDVRQRTSVDGVWAAGDCAEVHDRVARRPTTVALGTVANKTGRVAGINIGGGYATFPGVLGTGVTKVCGLEIARTGLGEQEAEEAGYAPICATVDSRTRAGYWPGARPIRIKLIAERGSGRLLGAQIVGEEGAAKRIDVLATALWNQMGVEELLAVDLSYAPPFSPLWDPVLIAARHAWSAVESDRG